LSSTEEAGSKQKVELDSIREWFAYNDYVRKKYLKVLETLPAEQLSKDRGASFPSLLDISEHILWAYRVWIDERYSGVPLDQGDSFGRKCNSLEELKSDSDRTNPHIMDFVQNLRPEDLDHWIERPRHGEMFRFNVESMLWHLVEEELQHRGELNALLWQMDVDPPITSWGRWKKETGQEP
jgi:uncharacterized damage-inducible protein DinB